MHTRLCFLVSNNETPYDLCVSCKNRFIVFIPFSNDFNFYSRIFMTMKSLHWMNIAVQRLDRNLPKCSTKDYSEFHVWNAEPEAWRSQAFVQYSHLGISPSMADLHSLTMDFVFNSKDYNVYLGTKGPWMSLFLVIVIPFHSFSNVCRKQKVKSILKTLNLKRERKCFFVLSSPSSTRLLIGT